MLKILELKYLSLFLKTSFCFLLCQCVLKFRLWGWKKPNCCRRQDAKSHTWYSSNINSTVSPKSLRGGVMYHLCLWDWTNAKKLLLCNTCDGVFENSINVFFSLSFGFCETSCTCKIICATVSHLLSSRYTMSVFTHELKKYPLCFGIQQGWISCVGLTAQYFWKAKVQTAKHYIELNMLELTLTELLYWPIHYLSLLILCVVVDRMDPFQVTVGWRRCSPWQGSHIQTVAVSKIVPKHEYGPLYRVFAIL